MGIKLMCVSVIVGAIAFYYHVEPLVIIALIGLVVGAVLTLMGK